MIVTFAVGPIFTREEVAKLSSNSFKNPVLLKKKVDWIFVMVFVFVFVFVSVLVFVFVLIFIFVFVETRI